MSASMNLLRSLRILRFCRLRKPRKRLLRAVFLILAVLAFMYTLALIQVLIVDGENFYSYSDGLHSEFQGNWIEMMVLVDESKDTLECTWGNAIRNYCLYSVDRKICDMDPKSTENTVFSLVTRYDRECAFENDILERGQNVGKIIVVSPDAKRGCLTNLKENYQSKVDIIPGHLCANESLISEEIHSLSKLINSHNANRLSVIKLDFAVPTSINPGCSISKRFLREFLLLRDSKKVLRGVQRFYLSVAVPNFDDPDLIYEITSQNDNDKMLRGEFSDTFPNENCDVYIFDPAMDMSEEESHHPEQKVHKFKLGVASPKFHKETYVPGATAGSQWHMVPLTKILDRAGNHDKIDILFADVHGEEWNLLQSVLESGAIPKMRQFTAHFRLFYGSENENYRHYASLLWHIHVHTDLELYMAHKVPSDYYLAQGFVPSLNRIMSLRTLVEFYNSKLKFEYSGMGPH